MNPDYTKYKFLQIEARPWHKATPELLDMDALAQDDLIHPMNLIDSCDAHGLYPIVECIQLLQDESRYMIMVGSTMRIPLLYRGEYSQWSERFMNYLEEQTDEEAMINSIRNGEHTLPVVAQDALERQMRGSKYGKQDRKTASLYEYETFRATEGEQLLDTYLFYLQVINDLKKCGYKKYNCDVNAMGYKKKGVVVTSNPLALVAEKTKESKRKEKVVVQSESEGSDDEDISDLKKITVLLAKDFNRKKYYAKPTNKNLRTSSASSSANKKPEYVKSEEKKKDKKADEKKRDISKVKCYNCKKEVHFAKDCKKAKVKDYNYYKTKMLLAKKDSDEQVLLTEDQAWMESSSDSDLEINADIAVFTAVCYKLLVFFNSFLHGFSFDMVFMAKMEKVLLDSEESTSSAEETIVKIVHICHSIIDVGCSKHMTGNRALLTNFVEKFLETVCFGNNYFAVIAGYGDVVIRLMTIKKVYYVEERFGRFILQFYDEYFDSSKITKSLTTNVETSNDEIPSHEEEVFQESSKSFQEESSSSSLNADVQQSSEEVMVPSSITQSISNNMVPIMNEASSSHNVFNE
nr:integrase, catalytic region, zinc finger, CCHC-type, peptidase aspartic, catalytic [Tanacetum cinerariifolium]